MALWKRAGIYYVKLASPDGTLVRRSTGTSDKAKAEDVHDKLKAQLWDLKQEEAEAELGRGGAEVAQGEGAQEVLSGRCDADPLVHPALEGQDA